MPQAYSLDDSDRRTFADLVSRIIQETQRIDLQGDAENFARDAIRHYSSDPFFFTEIDNTTILDWAASVYAPRGYTIKVTGSDGNEYILVNLVAGETGTVEPTWDINLFAFAGQSGVIFTPGQTGTTTDNECTWATIEQWNDAQRDVSLFKTQLSTVPTINQYVPPIDYVAPLVTEITCAGLRYDLTKHAFRRLRRWDVVRPAPVTVYPTEWAWFQEKIYLWPYPNGFYPLTLSYYSAPFPPRDGSTTNFWTTRAEAMVRNYAKARLQAERIYDADAAMVNAKIAQDEYNALVQRGVLQHSTGGIPPSDEW